MSIFDKIKSKIWHKKRHEDDLYTKIVVSENNVSKTSEGYNRLRDNILFMNADGNTKVIQVESAFAHEGKTTVACNLAVDLSFINKKVCVVDLDFRRPRTHRVFGLTKDNGVAEYVLGNISYEQAIKHTKYKNLDLVTRGAKVYNSSLLLISERFKEFMSKLREEYDYVILDCAPVLQVSDYIHISEASDGILLVVAYGITTKAQVSDAVKELKKNDLKILGSVFSMYDSKKDDGYGYYGKYYYSAYNKAYVQEDIDKEEDAQDENKSVQDNK